jgi:hypothetical protein
MNSSARSRPITRPSLQVTPSQARTAVDTLVPLSKFCGPSRIEYKVVLQCEQQEMLIAQTLARHDKNTQVEEKCADGHQKEP